MKKASNRLVWTGLVLSMALSACGGSKTPQVEAASNAPVIDDSPVHAIVSLPVGAELPADYVQRVAAWKSSDNVSDALLLQQFDGPEAPGFSSLTVLEFPGELAYRQWEKNEAGKLAPAMVVSRADVLADVRRPNRDSSKAVFVVSRYESLIGAADYKTYTDDYIVPNMSNQFYSGIMTRYTMFIEQEATPPHQRPKAYLLTEYANDQEFARKEGVKGAYKEVLLAHHPEWKRINDTKASIRTDLDETLARQVALP